MNIPQTIFIAPEDANHHEGPWSGMPSSAEDIAYTRQDLHLQAVTTLTAQRDYNKTGWEQTNAIAEKLNARIQEIHAEHADELRRLTAQRDAALEPKSLEIDPLKWVVMFFMLPSTSPKVENETAFHERYQIRVGEAIAKGYLTLHKGRGIVRVTKEGQDFLRGTTPSAPESEGEGNGN